MDILRQLLGSVLVASLIPIAVALGTLLGKLIKRAINQIDNEILQNVAWTAVTFVEQKFKDLNNEDKFKSAYDAIAKKLPGVSPVDIERAIESAVQAMNISKKSLGSSTNS